MIANPPYGKEWKRDQDTVRDKHDRGAVDRFVRVADQPSAVPSISAPQGLVHGNLQGGLALGIEGERTLLMQHSGSAILLSMGWRVETHSAADAEIEALPVKLRARLLRSLEAIENVGLEP